MASLCVFLIEILPCQVSCHWSTSSSKLFAEFFFYWIFLVQNCLLLKLKFFIQNWILLQNRTYPSFSFLDLKMKLGTKQWRERAMVRWSSGGGGYWMGVWHLTCCFRHQVSLGQPCSQLQLTTREHTCTLFPFKWSLEPPSFCENVPSRWSEVAVVGRFSLVLQFLVL